MRILLTTDTVGGVWRFTAQLMRGLLANAHQVALLSFGPGLSPDQAGEIAGLDADYLAQFRFMHSSAPLEWMQENGYAFDLGCADLRQMIDSFSPDVLHTNQFCFGVFASQAAGMPAIPTVVTAHSDVLSWAAATLPGGVAELEATADPTWLQIYRTLVRNGLRGGETALVPAHKVGQRGLGNLVVTAPTRWMAQALKANFEFPGEPVVIANGTAGKLDGGGYDPGELRKLQVVTAGRLWDPGKGLAILGDVASPIPILIAGEQSFDSHSAPLLSATFLGRLSQPALQQLFEQSAIYLGTSVYEPFGLAPLEAAMAGCGLVLRDLAPFREVWDDAAFYFQTAGDLERLLTMLATSPRRLKAAQCRARQRAARYSADAMIAAYELAYRSLLTLPAQVPERVLAHA